MHSMPLRSSLPLPLLSNAPIRELGAARIVERVGDNLLNLLWQSLLQHLRDDGLAGGVRDLARLGVAAGIVDGVWELVLDASWDLSTVVSKRAARVWCGLFGVSTFSCTFCGTEDSVACETPWPCSFCMFELLVVVEEGERSLRSFV